MIRYRCEKGWLLGKILILSFEDGEENKEVAFAFANALEAYEKESKEEKEAWKEQ